MIEPALTPQEWAARSVRRPDLEADIDPILTLCIGNSVIETTSCHDQPPDLAAIVALANAALPDGDPRKITRADVEVLNALAKNHTIDFGGMLAWAARLRDALESYLPPVSA